MLDSHLHGNPVHGSLAVDDIRIQSLIAAVQILDELLDSAHRSGRSRSCSSSGTSVRKDDL